MQPQANTSNLFTLFKIHKYGGNTNSYRTDKLAWLPQKCVEPKTAMTFKLGENQMKICTQEVANVLSYRWQWNEMTRPASEVHHKSHISAGIFHKRGNYRTSDQDFDLFSLSTFVKTIDISNKSFITSKTPSEPSEQKLAFISFASEYNSPFQKTRVAGLTMISIHQSKQHPQESKFKFRMHETPQSLALHCCGFMKEWIKITGDNFQTKPICGHFIVFLKSCMETFTQIFYSYFTA